MVRIDLKSGCKRRKELIEYAEEHKCSEEKAARELILSWFAPDDLSREWYEIKSDEDIINLYLNQIRVPL